MNEKELKINKSKIKEALETGRLIAFEDDFNSLKESEQTEIQARKKYYDALYKLREKREEKGITQEELAERSGISRITINRIEKGIQNVTLDKLIKIAHVLDVKFTIA